MPGWVKYTIAGAIVLLLLVVVAHLTGNGFGPGMHGAPPSSINPTP
jgi:hypothetical protein